METLSDIRDMSNTSSIFDSFKQIGRYFWVICNSPSISIFSVPDAAWERAVAVLHPVAFYVQMKAPDSVKEQLGEMLAADSEVIDRICEGILFPFIKEIGQKGPQEIRKSHMLSFVLRLHVCFMEFCQCTALRLKLIESGCVFQLFKELQNMTRFVQTDDESNKFARQLVQTATLVISNCLSDHTDLYMRLHPHTNIYGALVPYFQYPDSIVKIVCQLTYHQFSYYLHRSDPGSVDCPDITVSNYVRYLRQASSSKQLVVKVEKLFLEAEDLVKILKCLCCNERNRQIILDTSEFPVAVANLLGCGKEQEIGSVLSLLLTLLTEGQPIIISKKKGKRENQPTEDTRKLTKEKFLVQLPDFVPKLQYILENQPEAVKSLCLSLVWLLQEDPNKDFNMCLQYVKCCYKCGIYGECCYWSDYVGQNVSKNVRDEFLLYKAMAKYHIYQRESIVLRRLEKVQNLGEMKQSRERVFEDTKEVISILGSLKAKEFPMDPKCNQFLDCALMDYARELNKRSAKDSLYCMLCRKKGHIVHSHVIPESILKILLSDGHEKYILMGPSGQFFDSQVKTPHTITFNMLCSDCDTVVMNRDEGLFIENIAKPLYQTPSSDHVQKIHYEKWLFRFCAGIVFRNLALSRGVTGLINTASVLDLFHYCRLVVMQSPEVEAILELPPSKQKFPIGLLFTPGLPQNEPSNSSNLIRTLNSNNFVLMSISSAFFEVPPSAYGRTCHYCAVHFGVFTIIAFLEAVPDKYQQFLVNPTGGKLDIPKDSDRLGLIPSGLLKAFEEKNNQTVKHFFEKFVEVKADLKNTSITVLKSSEAESLARAESSSFCLLPPKFELNRQKNALTMKDGHIVLLHYTLEQPAASHTVFLCVEQSKPRKPYIILHSYCHSPTVSQTFGYYISWPDFAYAGDLDSDHSRMMHNIRTKNLDLFKFPSKVLPAIMKSIGICDYQSILYHFSRNPMPIFDKKCVPGNGCWYCSSKCDACMKDSPAGLTFFIQNDLSADDNSLAIRFDSEECKAFSSHSRDLLPKFTSSEQLCEVTFWVLDDSSFRGMHLLSFSISSYDEQKQTPFHISMDIYQVRVGTDAIQSGRYIGVFDVRMPGCKTFGEYFLSDRLLIEKPLPSVMECIDNDIVGLINASILETILRSSHDLDYFLSAGLHKVNEEDAVHEERKSDDDYEIGAALDF